MSDEFGFKIHFVKLLSLGSNDNTAFKRRFFVGIDLTLRLLIAFKNALLEKKKRPLDEYKACVYMCIRLQRFNVIFIRL